ncbi:MAG: DsrE family protein [bacterium]|nr:DsrE family protein [bacterium]
MKLGILAVNNGYADQLVALASAAMERGWGVKIFLNDQGIHLAVDPRLEELALKGAGISYCETSARAFGYDPLKIPRKLKRGTQLQHAMLQQMSDKVVVL